MMTYALLVLHILSASAGNNAKRCVFPNEPRVAYYWDENCKLGDLGCWADGLHKECRFCGTAPYVTECSEDAKMPKYKTCVFPVPPLTEYYWEPKCKGNVSRVDKGCKADGQHRQCRFCGSGAYADIPCPRKTCTFSAEPAIPYYWDSTCETGKKGCNADGIHVECRFCDAKPFLDVPCPPEFRPPYPTDECYFPQGTRQRYYWDNNCQLGLSGCYADGIHEQCRYCGHGSGGVFKHIPCPERTIFP